MKTDHESAVRAHAETLNVALLAARNAGMRVELAMRDKESYPPLVEIEVLSVAPQHWPLAMDASVRRRKSDAG